MFLNILLILLEALSYGSVKYLLLFLLLLGVKVVNLETDCRCLNLLNNLSIVLTWKPLYLATSLLLLSLGVFQIYFKCITKP